MTKFALNRPITIIMLTFALCLLGVISWSRLPVQLLPQFILPEVYISAGIAGANAEKIERDLVIPIEEEVATLEGVHDIESTVYSNFTNIKVKFDYGTNMKFAVLKLQQKMTAVENRIPEDVQIQVNKFDTADLSSFLMEISIRGDASLSQLRETAERRVLRRLEQIDGVVNVGIGGGNKRNLGIEIDADRCEALGIRVDLVQQKINAYHRQPQHLGRVITSGKMMDVVLLGRIDNLDELRNIIIRPQGMVRLKDVAKVDYSQEEQTRLYRVNGKPQVGIFIQKDNSSNMLKVAKKVENEIAAINKDLAPLDYELKVNFSQAEMIQSAIDRIQKLAITGAILAIIVLFLFLRNLRFVSILMIAIPISLLVTFNLMYGFNLSINILSLVGLALAIGMLVDNGIVVMENIFLQHQAGKSNKEAALLGTKGVSRSIFAATGTTILVFLPVLFVESEARLFIRELSLSVIFPLAVSLIVSLTLIPMIATRALRGKPFKPFHSGRIYEIYRLLLKSAIRHRIRTLSIVSILLLLSIFIGVTFIITQAPPPPSARMNLYVSTPKGSTLEVTDKAVRRIEAQMLELQDIDEVRANIRAEEANIVATFLDADQRTENLNLEKNKDKIRNQNERIENVDLSFDRPLRSGSAGQGNNISNILASEEGLRLKGYDLQGLHQISNQITGTLKGIPEIDNQSVVSDLQGGAPELQVIGDRMRLALWGLSMQNIMTAIWSTRSEGASSNTPYYSEQGEMDIKLILANTEERQLNDIGKIRVMNASGQLVPLNQVAKIRVDEGTGNIIRVNQERQVKITYKFIDEVQKSKGRQEMAKAQIDRFISELRLPKGFSIEKLENENVRAPYYWMLAIGFLLIYMFLAAQFESLSMPIIILGTVPTAVIGSLFALVITGTPLSLGQSAPMALLGLIVLLGIVVNNGIILLDRIAILRTQHHYRWQRAVIIAGQSRVRPILMTSATTILGLFPLALKQGTEFELWPPFAITVIGGLIVSTLSTLVFIPVLYVGLEQTKAWLKKIGWFGILLGTLASAAILYWIYDTYQSKIYTILIILPIWFIILGIIYSIQQFLIVKQEKDKLASQKFTIRIKNLTKIYGAPGRFIREWNREKRRVASFFAKGQIPWENEGIYQAAIWLLTIFIFIVYLHTFLSSSFWLVVLSLLNLICIFSARALWYKWRFVNGKPPKPKKKQKRWLFFKKKKNQEAASAEEITPLNFPKRGGFFIYLAFLAYLPIRTGSTTWTIIVLVLTLLLFQFYRIGRKIESGQIDPEQPKGKLKKIKRVVYAITKFIPIIRPPKQQVVALNGVSLNIGQGMFGLLGPNGAGKTTLMRILVGVLEADHGSIKINESLLKDHRATFHGSIGYLPQDFGLYENMTPLEYLNYHALSNNIYQEKEREELIEHTLKNVGIWDRKDTKIKTFSGGMKQRVGIAQTLLHLPQIIVVDEPTAGLDPKQRIKFRNLLADLAKDRIVVFSTHIVEDIASTCHDMAVLNKGEVVFNGSPREMQRSARGKVFEAIIEEGQFNELQKKLKIIQHSKVDNRIRLRFLSEQAVDELDAKAVEPTLEDAYVLLLQGKKNSEENGSESLDK
ncbi:efflux RND transporter permease subunit [candidate division KSB1 bacterium]|nr:efflux RND transporter permease subunit [candidate division KSB1 bacterium]